MSVDTPDPARDHPDYRLAERRAAQMQRHWAQMARIAARSAPSNGPADSRQLGDSKPRVRVAAGTTRD